VAIGEYQLQVAISETAPSQYNGWRRFCLAGAIALALISAVYFSTVQLLVKTWTGDSTYSHAFLILPIAAYLAWIRRNRLATVTVSPTFYSIPMMFIVSAVWLAGWAGSVNIVQQVAFVATLMVVLVGVWGFRAFRVLAFPISYLIFLVPFGDSLVQPLRELTTKFAMGGLELLHIPVLLDRHTIILSSGTWEVAEACSGLRFLIAAIALGTSLWGILQSWKHRIALIVIAIVTATVGNGLRALGIILLGYATNNKLAAGIDHVVYGWIFTSTLLAGLLWLAFRWAKNEIDSGEFKLEKDVTPKIAYPFRKGMAVLVALLIVSAIAPVVSAVSQNRPTATQQVQIISPWIFMAMPSTGWWPAQQNATSTWDRRYFDGKNYVDVHVTYASVRNGGIAPISLWNLESDDFWTGDKIKSRAVTVNGKPIKISEADLTISSRVRRVWNFYYVDQEFTGNNIRLKYLQSLARLSGNHQTAVLISISTESDTPEAVLSNWVSSATFVELQPDSTMDVSPLK
jgi:exosortase A